MMPAPTGQSHMASFDAAPASSAATRASSDAAVPQANDLRCIVYNVGITSDNWCTTNKSSWKWKALAADIAKIIQKDAEKQPKPPNCVVLQEMGPWGHVNERARPRWHEQHVPASGEKSPKPEIAGHFALVVGQVAEIVGQVAWDTQPQS